MKGDNWTIESLLRPHMKLIAAIVVLQILGAIAQVVSITLLKPIMNKGIYSDDMSEFIFLACALVTATLIVAAVLIVTTIMASHVATSVAEGLRVSIMNATVGVDDLGKLGSSPTDAMVCLTNDVASVQRYVFEGLRTYLPMPVLLILLLVLFVPIRFSVDVLIPDTLIDQTFFEQLRKQSSGEARFHWMLHLIRGFFRYPGEDSFCVKAAFWQLIPGKDREDAPVTEDAFFAEETPVKPEPEEEQKTDQAPRKEP